MRFRLRIVCSQDIVMEIAVAPCFFIWKVIFWFYFLTKDKPVKKVVGCPAAARGLQNWSSKNYTSSCVRNMNRRGGGKWALRDRPNWVLYLHSVVDLSFAWKISCNTGTVKVEDGLNNTMCTSEDSFWDLRCITMLKMRTLSATQNVIC